MVFRMFFVHCPRGPDEGQTKLRPKNPPRVTGLASGITYGFSPVRLTVELFNFWEARTVTVLSSLRTERFSEQCSGLPERGESSDRRSSFNRFLRKRPRLRCGENLGRSRYGPNGP
eukprot:GHVU01004924.1.p1 GENE.GHVU01004924.1~~GHVU01004924.1.p1  ORF type:complete len:116 (-),score=2.05 GHVU01004924.1:52-399(-)